MNTVRSHCDSLRRRTRRRGLALAGAAAFVLAVPSSAQLRRVQIASIPPPAAPGAVTFDLRIQRLMNQVTPAGLMDRLGALTGEIPITIGGTSHVLLTRYWPTAGCREAEQYAFESLEAAGLDVAYEPFVTETFYGACTAPGGQTGWICGSAGKLDRTSDGGASWNAQTPGTVQSCESVFSPATDTLWVVGQQGFIGRSDNGGANWAAQTSGTSYTLRDAHFRTTREGWIVGDHGTILHTTDGGIAWHGQATGDTTSWFGVQFVGADSGWASGGMGAVLRTTDGGATWTKHLTPTGRTLRAVRFVDHSSGWVVGDAGTILRSTDAGVTWVAQVTPAPTTDCFGVDFTSADEGWIAGASGTILHTLDAGAHWSRVSSGTGSHLYDIAFSDPQHGWAAGAGNVLRTTDGGASWTTQAGALPGHLRNVVGVHAGVSRPGRQILVTAHLDDMSDSASVVAPGADDNGSGTVTVLRAAEILGAMPLEKTVRFICFSGEEQGLLGSRFYAANAAARGDSIDAVVNADMIAHEDDGIDRVEVNAGTLAASAAIADVFVDVNLAYGLNLVPLKFTAVGSRYTSDHYPFWIFGYPAILVIEDRTDFSTDYHTTRDRVTTLDPSYFTRTAQATLGTVATLAGPLWTVDAEPPEPERALVSLGPNPATGGATLRLSLRVATRVGLELFDTAGRRRRSIDAGVQPAGPAAIRWDGRDDAGIDVAPGVLFYRARAGDDVWSGRLVVMR